LVAAINEVKSEVRTLNDSGRVTGSVSKEIQNAVINGTYASSLSKDNNGFVKGSDIAKRIDNMSLPSLNILFGADNSGLYGKDVRSLIGGYISFNGSTFTNTAYDFDHTWNYVIETLRDDIEVQAYSIRGTSQIFDSEWTDIIDLSPLAEHEQ
jgi:hypothetical protein